MVRARCYKDGGHSAPPHSLSACGADRRCLLHHGDAAIMIGVKKPLQLIKAEQGQDSRQILIGHEARQLIFAIVGHVGSGLGFIAQSLKVILESSPAGSYDTSIIKASNNIKEWAIANGEELPSAEKTLANVKRLQDLGDKMRETDKSAVARCLIKEIRATRAKKQNACPAFETNIPMQERTQRKSLCAETQRTL